MRTAFSHSVVLALLLAGCGRDITNSQVKMVGVGYNPDEIGPAPTPYGGVIEYNWINYAGAGLSLGFSGLLSFDEVTPNDLYFEPPLALIYGFSYIFDVMLDGTASVGSVQPAPTALDSCYTVFEGTGPIGSFNTTDVGTHMQFTTDDCGDGVDNDGDGATDGQDGECATSSAESGLPASFRLDRMPEDYPPDTQDMFIYYSSISGWRHTPAMGWAPGESNSASDMEQVILRPANFPFGEQMQFGFPGGVAGEHDPVGSLPLPSSAVGEDSIPRITMPNRQQGVMLSWNGPRYDSSGTIIGGDVTRACEEQTEDTGWDGGNQQACLVYHRPDEVDDKPLGAPASAYDCAPDYEYTGGEGQIYTGPWDTEDGQVDFQWVVPTDEQGEHLNPDEVVTLSIRVLGAVDREDMEYFGKYMVNGSAAGGDPRCGRETMSCEEGEWVFDPSLLDPDWTGSGGDDVGCGDLPLDEAPTVPTMQGDPFHTVAEVTCRLEDDGQFTLTNDMLESALSMGQSMGAEGVVFFFSRSTLLDAEVPDVKDAYDNRRKISPVMLAARTMEMGRFWYSEPCADEDDDGWNTCDYDCDDCNDEVHPGAEEIAADGVDNDCDGLTDEEE